jgi:hypothetical protein
MGDLFTNDMRVWMWNGKKFYSFPKNLLVFTFPFSIRCRRFRRRGDGTDGSSPHSKGLIRAPYLPPRLIYVIHIHQMQSLAQRLSDISIVTLVSECYTPQSLDSEPGRHGYKMPPILPELLVSPLHQQLKISKPQDSWSKNPDTTFYYLAFNPSNRFQY